MFYYITYYANVYCSHNVNLNILSKLLNFYYYTCPSTQLRCITFQIRDFIRRDMQKGEKTIRRVLFIDK